MCIGEAITIILPIERKKAGGGNSTRSKKGPRQIEEDILEVIGGLANEVDHVWVVDRGVGQGNEQWEVQVDEGTRAASAWQTIVGHGALRGIQESMRTNIALVLARQSPRKAQEGRGKGDGKDERKKGKGGVTGSVQTFCIADSAEVEEEEEEEKPSRIKPGQTGGEDNLNRKGENRLEWREPPGLGRERTKEEGEAAKKEGEVEKGRDEGGIRFETGIPPLAATDDKEERHYQQEAWMQLFGPPTTTAPKPTQDNATASAPGALVEHTARFKPQDNGKRGESQTNRDQNES